MVCVSVCEQVYVFHWHSQESFDGPEIAEIHGSAWRSNFASNYTKDFQKAPTVGCISDRFIGQSRYDHATRIPGVIAGPGIKPGEYPVLGTNVSAMHKQPAVLHACHPMNVSNCHVHGVGVRH